ncbi:hypothetical protein MXB_2216, partial [Myxobolus squamalis]
KHSVCYSCGELLVITPQSKCGYCSTPITGNEKAHHFQLFFCDIIDTKLKKSCAKSYLSKRDLSAHISHRHGNSVNFSLVFDLILNKYFIY